MPKRCSFSSLVLLACLPFGYSQSGEVSGPPGPVFQSHVRLVLLDVVVTDQNNQPVTGLQKDDFQVLERSSLLEQGKAQTIASFEEHRGAPRVTPSEPPVLPPHFYTNDPLVPPADSVNVLVLDALNTSMGDMSNVHAQMVSYLKALEPGPRLAIFTLSSRLNLVEGFTADPLALIAALNSKHSGSGPQGSATQRSAAEDNMDQQALAAMKDNHATAAAFQALQQFQGEVQGAQAASRVSITLDALQQLARYLSGFPGRKNVIWFSGSFPLIDFPSDIEQKQLGTEDRGVGKDVEKTVNALASAQVAVYPVAAQGLDTDSLYEASRVSARAVTGVQSPDIEGENQQLNRDIVSRYFDHKAMDDIATNTGGQAFYNTNGLKEALAEAVRKGSYYYRISYSPTDKSVAGRYRRIDVKLRKAHYTLAYRRGYYEDDANKATAAGPQAPADQLHLLMARGMPESTEILYKVQVLPSIAQPAPGLPQMGDNKNLRRAAARLSVDFIIPVDELDFGLTSDGVRHGNVELALIAYDHAGTPLNWMFRSIRTSLKPELYSAVQKTGAQFHQEIDVPEGEVYLCTGFYDLVSNKSGTLEIALSEGDLTKANLPDRGSAVSNTVPPQPPEGSAARTAPVPDKSAPPAPKSGNGSSVASTDSSIPPERATPASGATSGEGASEVSKILPGELDTNSYCETSAGTGNHSLALARVCEFALSMRKKLPDVICDREMKRYWTVFQSTWGGRGTMVTDEDNRNDVVTAKVSYRDGQEYYDDVRIDGKGVEATAPELSGTWSDGEFATILAGLFLQSTKAEFRFEKEATVQSARALVFRFRVEAQNNKFYFLRVDQKIWFPPYEGRFWIDKQNFQLLRLERETAYMPKDPITRMKTDIDYSDVPLGDGTRLVLPIHSDVLICLPPVRGNSDNCARNNIKFTNWHKFKATTRIVMSPAN
jgi:VWFA-related protein